MDLHYLELFNTIASLESFTKASGHLHISQSALSIQMRKFEDQLDLKLFNRIGNKITLNENGKILYEYSQLIFNMVTEAEYKLHNNNEPMTGTLQIGASNTPGAYIVPYVIAEYMKIYPLVKINLNIGNTSEIAHNINNGTFDFAINGGNMIYHKDVIAEKLMEDSLVLVASPMSEYAGMEHVGIEAIMDMRFVVHKTDSQLYTYYLNYIESLNLPEKVSITLGNIDAIKRAIMANIGVSLIPYSSVSLELKAGLLVRLIPQIEPTPYPYSLIYNRNKYMSHPAEKFVEVLRAYMAGMAAMDVKELPALAEDKNRP